MSASYKVFPFIALLVLGAMVVVFAESATKAADDTEKSADLPKERLPLSQIPYTGYTTQVMTRPMTPEEALRLRHDLNQYSRNYDVGHVQIEEARRVMRMHLRDHFDNADEDRNGVLSRLEVTDNMPQVARHFNQFDTDDDGTISWDEMDAYQLRMIEKKRQEAHGAAPQTSLPDVLATPVLRHDGRELIPIGEPVPENPKKLKQSQIHEISSKKKAL